MGFRVLSFFGFIISRIALNESKGTFFTAIISGEGNTTDLCLKGNTSKILLFIVLSNGKLVVSDVVSLQTAAVRD
jgi:hypothetical protein